MHALVPAALAALGLGACLDPLVDDAPTTSVYVLPPGSVVPRIDDDAELVHQIVVHDGLDDQPLADAMGVVARKQGTANGVAVDYWSFGPATKTGAAMYVLVDANGTPVDHPWLFDTLPGDAGYSAIRRIQHVTVTAAYRGQILPSVRALADAIDLGIVLPPEPTGQWIDAPIVPPGTTLDVGMDLPPAPPREVIADGHRVDAFVFGGDRGVQPLKSGAVPTAQASQLRAAGSLKLLDPPVFQLGIPDAPPTDTPTWTPIVILLEVQLAPDVIIADQIHADSDLFTRSMTGAITALKPTVTSYLVTENIRNWPTQFVVGQP
ncbi:MAG: hypothetical protein K8W52_43985 [Deltaproteobacteria bacterium]|nr:hypothetical protein [Deltaproteobacteria bacterium]